jgi:hypothetical protein
MWLRHSRVRFPSIAPSLPLGSSQAVRQRTLTPSCVGSIPTSSAIVYLSCGSGSVVEHRLAKARVAGSNPVFRSSIYLHSPYIKWRHSQVVRHGSAKPLSPVQIRVPPPITYPWLMQLQLVDCCKCGGTCDNITHVFCTLPGWWNWQTHRT